MSDVSNGDGWWIASDGKWYPPHMAPAPPQPHVYPNPYAPGTLAAYKSCPACGTGLVATATMCTRCGTPLSSPHSKGAAVLLAVFLTFWTWIYTYKTDAWKFWVGLVLSFLGLITAFIFVGFLILFGVWLWAVIDTGTKSEQWYQQYPNPV
jgi:hypothetical protein